MKRIGIVHGMERSFPEALLKEIQGRMLPGITAEPLRIGSIAMGQPVGFSVIVDRISHDIPFYRAWLKNEVLCGTRVINNPFWWSADDKFFNYALAHKMGIAIPRTVILPHHEHPEGTTAESMSNLQYPLDWNAAFDYVGFPAFLKPVWGGGWKHVYHVHNPTEFFQAYNQTGTLCMSLQAAVDFQEYFRCYVIGREKVRIMPYDPRRAPHERYVLDPPSYPPELLARVERDALAICEALGYDFNTVEFAVQNGVPYAIDFMNPAPDADLASVGAENFAWVVKAVADLAIRYAQEPAAEPDAYHWSRFLQPSPKPNGQTKPVRETAPIQTNPIQPDPIQPNPAKPVATKPASKTATKAKAKRP